MRKTILAAIAVCPMLIHAQVISPAQPKSEVTNPVLVSRLTTPATPGAFSEAAASAVPDRTPVRVYTGITPPKLIEVNPVAETVSWGWNSTETQKLAVVSLVVDASGNPSNLQMVRSLGPKIDRDVLAAVSQYRFQPATLNHESISMPLELTIKIRSRQ